MRHTAPATTTGPQDGAGLPPVRAATADDDGRSALAFCAARGRTTANACIGRYLSTSAADFPLQCRPPADRPTGRCIRS